MELVLRVEFGDRAAAVLERLAAALERRPGGAMSLAANEQDDRQPGGSPPAPVSQAPCPAPAAEAGAAAVEACQTPAPPPVRSDSHAASLVKARAARWSGDTWLSEARVPVFRAGWEAGEEVHALRARLAALPGPPMPGIRALAQKAWARGWRRPEGYTPPMGRPTPRGPVAPLAWQTPERLAEMRRLVEQEGASWPRVTEVLSAMPGPPMPQFRASLKRWARLHGVVQAERPITSWRNPARAEVMRRDWPAGVDVRAIKAALEALPGLPVPHGIVCLGSWAADLGLRRPAGHVGAVNRPARPARDDTQRTGSGEAVELPARPAGPAAERGDDVPAGRPLSAPPALVSSNPGPKPVPPRLPAPSGGKHYCSFREIKLWAAHYGIAYTGANIDAVNKRRKLMGLMPVVQDEDRTAADVRAA